jgi:hypothetical protein
MRDRKLEKNIERVQEFVELWKQLSQFLDRGFKGTEFSGDEEAGFLELKSSIAQEHEFLATTLGSEMPHEDKTLRLLNSLPSLAGFRELPEGMGKKITSEWHSTFIAMQSLLGRLRGRKSQLASMSSLSLASKRVLANPFLVLFLIVAAGYGVYKFCDEVIPILIRTWEKQL